MVDNRTLQHPSSRRHAIFRFAFRNTHGTAPCAKSEAKLAAIRIRTSVGKNNTRPAYCPFLFSGHPLSFRKRVQGPGQDAPSPRSFRAPLPRARALWPLMSSTPTTRSRTLLFLSYRDSRASSSTSHHRYAPDNDADENERLIDPPKDHIAVDVGLPPKWSGRLHR